MDRDEVPSIDSATSRAPTVVMTGATNGFGLLAAAELASRGARLVLMARSTEKGAAAAAAVRSRVPAASVEAVAGDVASIASVRAFAATVKQRCSQIDVLINNAGAVIRDRRSSVDGHELMFATNYLGAFALTTALLDRLQTNAPSRIISTTSFAERFGPIRFDDLESARAFSSVNAYGQSKRALLMFTFALARRLGGTGVSVNAFHPGICPPEEPGGTSLGRRILYATVLNRPADVASSLAELAIGPRFANVTGGYSTTGGRPARASSESQRRELQDRLWTLTEKLLTGNTSSSATSPTKAA